MEQRNERRDNVTRLRPIARTQGGGQNGQRGFRDRGLAFFFLIVTVLLLLVGAIFYLSYRVKVIEIVDAGLGDYAVEDVEALVAGYRGQSYFSVDLDAMAAQIEREPKLKVTDIQKEFSGTVTVHVAQRLGLCYVPFANAYLELDGDGVVLAYTEKPRLAELPLVSGFEVKHFKIGQAITVYSKYRLDGFLQLVSDIHALELDAYIKEIIVYDYFNYMLVNENGIKIDIGTADSLQDKLEWLTYRDVRALVDGSMNVVLDLSIKDPVLRWRDTGDVEALPPQDDPEVFPD